MALSIRLLTADDDLAAFGRIVLTSYEQLPGHPADAAYDAELLDVGARLARAPVIGAWDATTPLGCVTYVPDPANPYAEHLRDDEAGFRMLGVAPSAQGRGVGAALVEACLSAARAGGRRAVFIHSGDWMTTAHHLYHRLGFRRADDRDWDVPGVGVRLLAFERPI